MATFLLRAKSRLSSWTQPLRNAVNDYMQVAKDTRDYVKTHPYKFTVMCALGGILVATWRKNPDANSYTEEVLCYSNEISQCSEQTRNKDAHKYITDIIHQQCTGLLQHVNFGFLSLVLRELSYRECYNYPQRCKYLQPKWNEHLDRVVDVGFWGKWWILNKRMVDFDVNEDELSQYL